MRRYEQQCLAKTYVVTKEKIVSLVFQSFKVYDCIMSCLLRSLRWLSEGSAELLTQRL